MAAHLPGTHFKVMDCTEEKAVLADVDEVGPEVVHYSCPCPGYSTAPHMGSHPSKVPRLIFLVKPFGQGFLCECLL